jgi:pyridoxamine 5'-phosphate oxidase
MLAPWRSPLARALHRNRALPYARYFQLATVRSGDRPANRTVVFRGFLDSTNQLKIITDARSEKIPQIDQTPWGEACWYFPKTREQFRLYGHLTLITAADPDPQSQPIRQKAWQELSDAARIQFTWATPKQLRTEQGFPATPPASDQPLANFCLLLLDPVEVDHLELRGDPQNRSIYQLQEGDWITATVNP